VADYAPLAKGEHRLFFKYSAFITIKAPFNVMLNFFKEFMRILPSLDVWF